MSPEVECARTPGVMTISTVIGAIFQLPGMRTKFAHMMTEIATPKTTDQIAGPSRYKHNRPAAQPIKVFKTRDLNTVSEDSNSGSETTTTEIIAQMGSILQK